MGLKCERTEATHKKHLTNFKLYAIIGPERKEVSQPVTYAQIQAEYDAYCEKCLKEGKIPKDFWSWSAGEE